LSAAATFKTAARCNCATTGIHFFENARTQGGPAFEFNNSALVGHLNLTSLRFGNCLERLGMANLRYWPQTPPALPITARAYDLNPA
jgi:hypothetical protein